jgi:hypothetical protein
MRSLRDICLAATILGVASISPAAAQQACGMTGGTCSGYCPALQFCGLEFPGMDHCRCQGGDGTGSGCGGNVMIPVQEETFAAALSDASGGPQLLAVGNGVTLSQLKPITVEIHHATAWGGGVQTVTVPTASLTATIRVTGVDATDSHRRTLVVTGIGLVLPSFASIALGGGFTGDNTFSADPNRSGGGWVDVTTGSFHVQLYARMFNGVFQAQPALIQTVIDGTVNVATRKITLTGLPSGFQVLAASPDTTLW